MYNLIILQLTTTEQLNKSSYNSHVESIMLNQSGSNELVESC